MYRLGERHSQKDVMILSISKIVHNFISDLLCRYSNIDNINITAVAEGEVQHEVNGIIIRGRYDNVMYICLNDGSNHTYLLEIKTTSRIDDISEPLYEHLLQINFYLGALGISKGYILYVDRKNFSMKIFEIDYNKALFDEVINRALLLHQCIQNNIVPVEFNFKFCSSCPYVKECREYMGYTISKT